MEYKTLNRRGTVLDKEQLEKYLENLASDHILQQNSNKNTYPIPKVKENFTIIQEVYNLLNEHIKLGIPIHPAGEWLLDNFYIIDETVKTIIKEMPLNKYTKFLAVANGLDKGFARVYVLAYEIINFTDNKIDYKNVSNLLCAYQRKKSLSMEEIWNIGIFMQISLIQSIRDICEKIYFSQMQKYRVENILERLVEKKPELKFKNLSEYKARVKGYGEMKYPFIEYLSYRLKKQGKSAYSFIIALEEQVNKMGTTIEEVLKKEHFDIAIKKVSMANCITSMKELLRMDFLSIFEQSNKIEEILKKDPAKVYVNMEQRTKEYYRNSIKEISKKTKISEFYIASKALELSENEMEKQKDNDIITKQTHIGYYLIDEGKDKLYEVMQIANKKIKNSTRLSNYILATWGIPTILSIICAIILYNRLNLILISIIMGIILWFPLQSITMQITQYVLGKIVKPKMIPKMNFQNGIPKEYSTFVVIPTILKSKEKVQELMKKLEVFYLANKSENIYFTLLGDCSQSDKKEEDFDLEVIKEGKKQVEILNKKYKNEIFQFIYRKRILNEKEGCYLGWERKRGLITQFNEYLLGNTRNQFRENTIEKSSEKVKAKLKNIKYVITLDADTDLILNSAFELVGAMAHILNKPVIDKQKNIVVDGYGIIQPRVGINLPISYKTLFTKIFAGSGGTDSYTNAISDTYQDNFKEGIFTGKGIYDLKVFSKVLRDSIPENTVLSHDLLEGCYLRCGLASDILLMDGYPTKYNSFMNRLARWIRGDWQIIKWIKLKSPLNLLSKYKIFDNLRRSLFEISIIVATIYVTAVGILNQKQKNFNGINLLLLLISILPFLLELLNKLIFKKEGEQKQKTFTPKISGAKGAIYRGLITLGVLPYKAYISGKSICKTLYRTIISHKHLLEWTTSEEAEKQAKSSLVSYYNQMWVNFLAGIISIGIGLLKENIFGVILGLLWIIIPMIMWYISKEENKPLKVEKLNNSEQEYVLEIGKRTWDFFEKYLNKENNYLITDNYQEDRKEKIVPRTSSTNIGLSLLAVISAYDLKYINLEKTLELLGEILTIIESLPKWNGHLYNWYNTKTKEPLIPRYVSTVDSGNFVGYLYVVKQFLVAKGDGPFWQPTENDESQETVKKDENKWGCQKGPSPLATLVENLIEQTDFSVLYNKEQQIFSIGFNIEENKLTDSYYDLLASEARQASIVAIAKKDVPSKHWNHLSRTLTTLGKYKGLISWSGTAFEYLMPNVNIPKYEGSLLDESCKFLIMSQMEYAKKLNIPWGISEAAFNVKDLKGNYQYKAFGIPWLGLKRGLADELVVSSYGSMLAITECPKEQIENLKRLESEGMYGKYGFYESIDFTPERVEKGKTSSVVKTYMAHHQGLILLSINNLFNDNILQKRFAENPEIEAVSILIQETMPDTSIITKEQKEKPEKLKYKDYENYVQTTYNKIDERLVTGNVISNENYVIAMNQKGQGVSKYKNYYINRFKTTDDYPQGIFFTFKNIKNKNIWSSNYSHNEEQSTKYQISFMPDKDEQEILNGNIKTKIKTTVASNEPIELRRLILENQGQEEEILEVTTYFEPVLSLKEQDYAHPVFNNLFLMIDYDEENNSITIKRRSRQNNEKRLYARATLSTESETVGDLEYETSEEKFIGRGNLGLPIMIKNSIPLSKKIGLVTEPVIALKRTIKVKPGEETIVDFILSVGEEKEKVKENLQKFKSAEKVKTEFELSKARVEAESRYLRLKGRDIAIYQKMLSYIIFDNPLKNSMNQKQYKQEELWKYGISGDLPIILVKIQNINEAYIIKEVLKAYEFFRTKNIETEVVILDEERYSYENYVREEIENSILNNHMGYLKNIKGGIFTLSKGEVDKKDIELLEFLASITIDSKKGGIKNSIDELEEEYLEKYKNTGDEQIPQLPLQEEKDNINILANPEELKYYNEYGGFSPDGKEYWIRVNKENRLPTVWSHILANEKFGTVVTENMGGYSWYLNSRLNRITSWENNPSYDIPSEVIYLKNAETKKAWSLGLNPMPDNQNYNIIYGFGYSKYLHKNDGIEQELTTFVPKDDSCKISILNLKNTTPNRKKMKLYYYMKPVIGEDELKSNGFIATDFDKNNNIIIAKNLYRNELEETKAYVSCSEEIISYTGDKNFFLGAEGISNPKGLQKVVLNNQNSLGRKPCIAYEVEIELESFANKEISIILGAEENTIDCKNMAYKYSKLANCKQELEKIKNYWQEILGRVQVYTPLESTNIILNGWALYQTITSRLLGRSGYYQSGGAFGFRDQLQDTLALKYIEPEILKNQIIKHSKHQFIEGDVLHWWHDETKRGIRTKFSDDLLWLVYLTIEYVKATGDMSILDVETPYLQGAILGENEDEKYDKFLSSDQVGTIYDHCIRAIEKSLSFGENGLPKIGSGDWNDGFSTVGNKGKGESVWLGFFQYFILEKFSEICRKRGDEQLAVKYEEIKNNLKRSLNTNGWDGRWFRRAFTDDGHVLGSMENDECRIDGISQSWSIISNAGDNDKKYISIESLENHLVDRENGIIKLLDPPFEKGKLEPGYIKAYLPGVRENGGQYTHAATWVIIAEAILGFGDKALDLYRMINPIEHSRTKEASQKYKVEPYVISADVYGASNLAGRGGWTWYTGSSSWYYKAGIEYILGLKVEKGYLKIEPCIPKDWKEYQIRYKWKDSVYNIKVKNPNGKNTGVTKVIVNGVETENLIKLDGSGKVYNVEVRQ